MTDLSPDVQGLLDESYESDLTEKESEQLLLLCGHGIGPKLSPAAQAVLDAFYTEADRLDRGATEEEMIAAALRAAADQVVPLDPVMPVDVAYRVRWDARQSVRSQLLAIADELADLT
jgi:hypothetical protein